RAAAPTPRGGGGGGGQIGRRSTSGCTGKANAFLEHPQVNAGSDMALRVSTATTNGNFEYG
ncbi:MAG: hypothetical protein ACI915_005588, partial [Gammaproteobacteria bacterium]